MIRRDLKSERELCRIIRVFGMYVRARVLSIAHYGAQRLSLSQISLPRKTQNAQLLPN